MPSERFTVQRLKSFSTASIAELQAGKEIQAIPYGEFPHPLYGDVSITPEIASTFKRNFDDNVFGQELPIYFEHFGMDSSKGLKAAGWVKGVRNGDDAEYWTIAFTEEAAKEILDGAWKYFSPEWHDVWMDNDGMIHTYVAVGGALTNRPFFKGMVPLNFSELMASSEEWDKEHSEPGSGQPPVPHQEDDDALDAPGTRGTTPDVTYTEEELQQLEARSMEEFLAKLRLALGLTEDKKEEDVLVAMSGLVAEVKPLREAAEKADKRMVFSEQYPAEFARMAALEEAERKGAAKAFADRFALRRLVKTEGEGDEKKEIATPFGFSAATITALEDMHLAFSEGKMTHTHMENALDSLLQTGLVDYSERGSSIVPEDKPLVEAEAAPKAFAELVASIQVADKVDRAVAIQMAAEKNPELFKAYRERFSSRT